MCYSIIKTNGSFVKKIIFTILFLSGTTSVNASPLYFSFDGIITGFFSDNDLVTPSDYNVVLGQTNVSYVFEVDFDLNRRSVTDSIGTWDYFYSDLLKGGIVSCGFPEVNKSYNFYGYNHHNQGTLHGGSRVFIWTSNDITTSWRVEDWYVGQQLRLVDGGIINAGNGVNGDEVDFFGYFELKTISSTNPVPLPGTLQLFVSALGGLSLVYRRKR